MYQIIVKTDNSLSHAGHVLKIAVPLGDSWGMRGGRRERKREGFLLPHQSFGSRPTDANGRYSGWFSGGAASTGRQPQGAHLAEI